MYFDACGMSEQNRWTLCISALVSLWRESALGAGKTSVSEKVCSKVVYSDIQEVNHLSWNSFIHSAAFRGLLSTLTFDIFKKSPKLRYVHRKAWHRKARRYARS